MDWLYPSRLARMHWLVHSPLLERFYSEMERVSRFPPQLVPLPMPNKSNWRVGDGLSSRSAMVFGTATYFGGQSNLHFFLVLAHYVHSRRPEVKFRIFGEGPLSPHIRRMIADLGLENVVETQVTDSPQCDAFLYLPMTNEHFIPILMAASAKIPVLSVDVPGIENYVTDGHDGFVVPMHDVRSLGELCFRFIENREMARFFGDRLKQKLERHFSWNVLQPVYNEFLLGETQLTVQSRAA
jgi:glycosyltransferase involved in cell wall biosynthesis